MVHKCNESFSTRVEELYVDGKWVATLHDYGWSVAAFFTICACAIAFWLLWMHAAYYHKPWEQRHIARILLMLPVYSIISLLSYIFYPWAMAYNTVSSAYEAFALCSFFLLLRTYLDPDVRGLKHDLRLRVITYWAWPLSYQRLKKWLRLSPMNGLIWYNIIAFGISQYAILRPTLAIASIVLNQFGLYCETTLSPAYGNFYVFVLQSVSVAIAMYCVVAFYLELKEEPALKANHPLMKLTCIKLVIFLIFWQSIFLQLMTVFGVIKDKNEFWSARDVQTGFNALATCVEMAVFAILHISAFTYKVYIPDDLTKTTHRWKLVVDAFNFLDFIKEFVKACRWIFSERKRFDPDGFDVERDDMIYDELRVKRLRKNAPKCRSISTAIPVFNHVMDPVMLKPHFGRQSPSHGPRATIQSAKSVSIPGEMNNASFSDLAPPPKLRVLQTRSRSASISTPTSKSSSSTCEQIEDTALQQIDIHSASELKEFRCLMAIRKHIPKEDRVLGR